MTTHKVEKMMERIKPNEWPGNELFIDPHKLAEVLCEMEERMEAWNPAYGDKEADKEHLYEDGYKAGYLAALEEVKKHITSESIIDGELYQFLDDLKKKYETT